MYGGARHFAAAAVIGFCIIPATAARAEDEHRDDEANRYVITNLVSDLPGAAAVQDNVLQNSDRRVRAAKRSWWLIHTRDDRRRLCGSADPTRLCPIRHPKYQWRAVCDLRQGERGKGLQTTKSRKASK
jgi:hypothetical protein